MMGREDHRLLVRARRTGPGTPVAFLVKALEGTLRRYHPDLTEVELLKVPTLERAVQLRRPPILSLTKS